MSREFRYPLTRFCLRSGTMTLPLTMSGLFHEEGSARAIDSRTGQELELGFSRPRTVTGLGELYRRHDLAVNDELHVTALDDGRLSITAVARPKAPDYTTTEALTRLLDELAEAGLRMTPQEVAAVYEVPDQVDLDAVFEADGRFVLLEGRWTDVATAEDIASAAAQASARVRPTEAAASAAVVDEDAVAEAVGVVAEATVGQAVPSHTAAAEAALASSGQGHQPTSMGLAGGGVRSDVPARQRPAGHSGSWEDGDTSGAVFERRAPAPVPARAIAEDDDEDAFDATALVDRLRQVVRMVGYGIEPLGHGQVELVAAMGRRSHKVLVQILSPAERLDWADLLAKRRKLDVRHLAVVGDHQALVRLTGPAELARATLWSWQALDRLKVLTATVPLSPIDLEPHFARDGLFEEGLERFERTVAERVAERGAVSAVLTRLNVMRAPTVFLLEDLASELGMQRDRVLGILERLSAAPFSLLARVDRGEFVLRQPVDAALGSLSDYAISLKERLPQRRVERITGHGEPLLMSEEDLWDESDAAAESDKGSISA